MQKRRNSIFNELRLFCIRPSMFSMYGTVHIHYDDVIMGAIASQITSLTIVYSTVYSDANQRKHQSSASLAFVWGIHRGAVNSPHKWPVTRNMFPFDDVIMQWRSDLHREVRNKGRLGQCDGKRGLRRVISAIGQFTADDSRCHTVGDLWLDVQRVNVHFLVALKGNGWLRSE